VLYISIIILLLSIGYCSAILIYLCPVMCLNSSNDNITAKDDWDRYTVDHVNMV
jgi:hypothetical protein